MAYTVGLLVLVIGLLVSIALHELGHLLPAKRFGVRVSRYMVGFGPTLWSRTKGETEYGFKAIPLGGYCRLVGMLPSAEAVGAKPRGGPVGQMIQEARDASAEEIEPGEEYRAFYRLSTPKKVTVMLGGPVMNLVVASVLFAVVMVGIGLPGAASTTVAVVGECVYPADAMADFECGPSDRVGPGSEAGIQAGDVLVSFDGRPVEEWTDFSDAVQASVGAGVPLVVERDGEQVTLTVDPIITARPVFVEDTGEVVVDDDGEMVTEMTRYVGISPEAMLERQPISDVVPVVGELVWESVGAMVQLPLKLVDVGEAVFLGRERDAGVMGVVGMGRAAGEIATAESPGYGIAERAVSMLLLIASLNVALFVFNLIPLLPLDGGHVVGALWEGAKRQVARLRGLSRPVPADMARMMPLAYGTFVVLAAMGLFLVIADIVAPANLG